MASDKHTHSIHIDAPWRRCSSTSKTPRTSSPRCRKKPRHPGRHEPTPDGAVSSYEIKYRELRMHLTAVVTREESVDNERIVDHSSVFVHGDKDIERALTTDKREGEALA